MSEKKKILVTGGAGYIGSHTVVELINNGYEVVIVDNLSNSYSWIIDRIEQITSTRPHFIQVDVCDKETLQQVLKKHANISGVIHFAAYKAVGESVEKPLLYYRNNIVSLISLLELMLENNIGNVVFSSSCTVYGEPDHLPVSENTPTKKASSPYGNTKKIGEDILHDTTNSNKNLRGIALRYFNPVGAHPSALIGELPLGTPNNLAPVITQTAIGIRKNMKVFGKNYPTPDGTCIRDYIHVTDLAKAHVKALDRLLNNKNKSAFETFNIGTGKGNSVLEVITAFEKISEKKLNYQITEKRPGDVSAIYADTTYANDELGWKAQLSLNDMMDSAWKWQQKLEQNKNTNEV